MYEKGEKKKAIVSLCNPAHRDGVNCVFYSDGDNRGIDEQGQTNARKQGSFY